MRDSVVPYERRLNYAVGSLEEVSRVRRSSRGSNSAEDTRGRGDRDRDFRLAEAFERQTVVFLSKLSPDDATPLATIREATLNLSDTNQSGEEG